MDNLIISTRDFNFTEDDFQFTYDILKKRYNNKKSLIKYITTSILPSYQQHKDNIYKFKKLIICLANDMKIGFCTIDSKNYVGYFYSYKGLKNASKLYPELLKKDLSSIFFYALAKSQPVGTILLANISSENNIANKTASKFMQHIGSIYAYKVE